VIAGDDKTFGLERSGNVQSVPVSTTAMVYLFVSLMQQ
jgi:hypothetical protein